MILFLLLGLALAADTAVTVNLNNSTQFFVTVSVACPEITFVLSLLNSTANDNTYIGFGIGSETMSNSDIVICYYSSGQAFCKDYWGEGNIEPTLDDSQDVEMVSSSKSNGASMTFTYTRALSTGDSKQDNLIVSKSTLLAIWSIGTLTSGAFNKHTYKGTANITLPTTDCHDISARMMPTLLLAFLINTFV